ncbi:tropomyosin A-like [Pituophis catenifer annectens]|uniref:tropomyosin A-like n=1 Tax=Pituophis catenifer annectens TaxID=94852 RepID=UPI0039957F93
MAFVRRRAHDNAFEKKVRHHFNQGLCELTSVVNCLYHAKEDVDFYIDLKEHIGKATEELGKTEELVLWDLKNVDAATSEIMVSKKKLMDEQKAKENELVNFQNLRKDLQRRGELQKEDYQRQKAMKEKAKRDREAAAEEIREQERRKDKALRLMWIPVVGTIIGGIQAIDAHMSQKAAEEKADAAQEMVNDYHANEQKALHQVAECEKQLENQESKIKTTQKNLEEMEEQKKQLTDFHKDVLNLQEALRGCSNLVGTLHSEANAVRLTSQYVFIYDALKPQIDSLTHHMLPFLDAKNPKHRLLDCPKIRRSIKKLKFFSETPSTLARNTYTLMDMLADKDVRRYFVICSVILALLWATGFLYKTLLVILIGCIVFCFLA